MSSNYKIIFHVGYPKTASTSLQSNLFDYHSEINYLSQQSGQPLNHFYRYIKKRIDSQSVLYDDIVPYLTDKKINVFSSEDIIAPGILVNLNNTNKTKDQIKNQIVEKAHLIKYYFPDSKIIIIIRNQAELLRSAYDWSTIDIPINDWLSNLFANSDEDNSSLLFALDFYRSISTYYQVFGSNNVKVLLFEDLKSNPASFSKELSKFMGISEKEIFINLTNNPKNTYDSVDNLYKKLNKRYFSFGKYLPKSVKKEIRKIAPLFLKFIPVPKSSINKANFNKIKNYYAKSNQKLVDLIEKDLAKYHYPL